MWSNPYISLSLVNKNMIKSIRQTKIKKKDKLRMSDQYNLWWEILKVTQIAFNYYYFECE